MTALGSFRDDYYNSAAALTAVQNTAISAASPTIVAQQISGAVLTTLVGSGQTTAQTWTTDTGTNIVAWLQQVVAAAYKTQIAGFGQTVNPPVGIPNLFNLTYTLRIYNINTASGAITLTAGAGVTISGSAVVAIATAVDFVVSFNSPNSVTITRVASVGTVAA
jgi:hypothetical protein